MTTITFVCKDSLIARYCDNLFRKEFEEDLKGSQILNHIRNGYEGVWTARLLREAKKQGWYDYEVVGDGDFIPHHRRVIRDEDGTPKLLIPEVRIEFSPENT